jgi:phosphoserine phosphatase RsbU/P
MIETFGLMSTKKQLTIHVQGEAQKTIVLTGHPLSLGRSPENELSYPDDSSLSRHHLILERTGQEWAVRDLGSKNGTYLNGRPLKGSSMLRPGDRIVASKVTLLYEPGVLIWDAEKPLGPSTEMLKDETAVTTSLQRLEANDWSGTTLGHTQWGGPVATLIRAGRELVTKRPLPELLQVILHLSLEAVGAQRGILLTSEKNQLVVQASKGSEFRISTTVRDRVLKERTSLLVPDTRFDRILERRESIITQNVQSLMAVPLQTDDRVLGLIYVDSPRFPKNFTADDLTLLTVMGNIAAIRLEQERLVEVEQAELIMERELDQAADIQRNFLPGEAPSLPGLDLSGFNFPCRTVGGDYYDFLPYDNGTVALVIGDVAGKALPAALLMTCLQAKVQAYAEIPDEPARIVTRVNRSLTAICPDNRFVTLFFCLLDPAKNEITYCNAGHCPPFLLKENGEVLRLHSGGPVLGLFSGRQFEQQSCPFSMGDTLVLYTDGVTEAQNKKEEEFGEDRLETLLQLARHQPAGAIVAAVREAVEKWTGTFPGGDDFTLVAARRHSQAAQQADCL